MINDGNTLLIQTIFCPLYADDLHISDSDLSKVIYIRNQGHTILEAINRQLSHYPHHIGQIVFIGKMLSDKNWNSLSIPKGGSKEYNQDKFSKPKTNQHFTDELSKKNTQPFHLCFSDILNIL